MLKHKPFREITGYESERRIIPQDEEILICLNCPLPKCDKLCCKRYEEEKKKLKGIKNDKQNKKTD